MTTSGTRRSEAAWKARAIASRALRRVIQAEHHRGTRVPVGLLGHYGHRALRVLDDEVGHPTQHLTIAGAPAPRAPTTTVGVLAARARCRPVALTTAVSMVRLGYCLRSRSATSVTIRRAFPSISL